MARESQIVATAVHADDHYGYPDCRPQFVKRFDAMERRAVEGFVDPNIHLHTPFVQKTRVEIVEIGTSLGVPYEDTWSCYGGGEIHWVLC